MQISAGDTAWMLTSAALVFLMSPGLAFFYSGLVRRKNALNTLMMTCVAMSIGSLVWMVPWLFAGLLARHTISRRLYRGLL